MIEILVGRHWPFKHASFAVEIFPFNWTRWGACRFPSGFYVSLGPVSFNAVWVR